MNNLAYEIISAALLYIAFISLLFLFKKKRSLKKDSSTYKNYRLNYNFVIYGFGTVMILSSITVLAVVFIDLKDFSMMSILPVCLFLASLFLSFFYVIGTRN